MSGFLFFTEIMGLLHVSTFVWAHIEQKLQIKKTLESSAKMISTEDRESSRSHCNQAFFFTFTNYTCLKCEVGLKGVDQPVKKHQSEIDQQKEAVAILEVLHENGELPGSGQQQVGFLSL